MKSKDRRHPHPPIGGEERSPTEGENSCFHFVFGLNGPFIMLTRDQKGTIVTELQDRFARQRISLFTDIRGVSVAKLSQFRRELKKLGAEFKVAKKTLLKRALDGAHIILEPKELEGEIGVIFGYEDQVAPAKLAVKFGKANETFKILKGILDGKIIEGKAAVALAKLPTREQLLATVAAVLQAPIRNLASALQANIRSIAIVLNQLKEQKAGNK
jgi:large subunit ribosomal protein L10